MKRFFFFIVFVSLLAFPLAAQDFQQGFAPFQSYDIDKLQAINLSNGNLVLDIPLISYSQRGSLPDIGYNLGFNNTVWNDICVYDDFGDLDGCAIAPSLLWSIIQNQTGGGVIGEITYGLMDSIPANGYVLDASGAVHSMANSATVPYPNSPLESIDATGIREQLSTGNTTVIDNNGITSITTPVSGSYYEWLTQIHDPTGNAISLNYDISTGVFTGITDSIGRSIAAFPTLTTPGCTTVTGFPGPPSNASLSIEACYSNHTLQSNVGCSTYCSEYSGTTLMLDSVTLPNNTTYTFQYDTYGDVTGITLPTGGAISYQWGLPPGLSTYLSWETDWTIARQVTSKTLGPDPSNPSSSKTWTYAYTTTPTTTVTDQDGNYAIHSFTDPSGGEASVAYYNGSSALLKTVNETYFGSLLSKLAFERRR